MCAFLYLPSSYTPFDRQNKSEFKIAFKDACTLQSILLNYRPRGLFIDASWRNKNENRAAMTVVAVVNEEFHVTPGSLNPSLSHS